MSIDDIINEIFRQNLQDDMSSIPVSGKVYKGESTFAVTNLGDVVVVTTRFDLPDSEGLNSRLEAAFAELPLMPGEFYRFEGSFVWSSFGDAQLFTLAGKVAPAFMSAPPIAPYPTEDEVG